MMKNVLYFTLKALSVLKKNRIRINGLIRKIRFFSKFMTSQPGKKTIATRILSNVSRMKNNQTRKFGQLIEYKMRNIFL